MATIPRTTARDERSPTVETLVVLGAVFLVQWPLSLVGLTGLFALSPAVIVAPWTLVTSTYSHAGPVHLLSNAVVLLAVGLVVERVTTRLRYHAFFVVTGAVAGLAQVFVWPVTGATGVLGASGAVFALLGYLVAGNVVADRLLGGLDRLADSGWASTLVLLAGALVLAVALSGPNSALVAHLVGLLVGLASGRARLLHVGGEPSGDVRRSRERYRR
jgi:membrane associated rhomboid family serine protease